VEAEETPDVKQPRDGHQRRLEEILIIDFNVPEELFEQRNQLPFTRFVEVVGIAFALAANTPIWNRNDRLSVGLKTAVYVSDTGLPVAQVLYDLQTDDK
jgi:hypothetical protein